MQHWKMIPLSKMYEAIKQSLKKSPDDYNADSIYGYDHKKYIQLLKRDNHRG